MGRIKSIKYGKQTLVCSFIILTIFFSAISFSQSKWTKLEYDYNSGALPYPYNYDYKIIVHSNGTAELFYHGHYKSDDKNTSDYTVEIEKQKFKNLKSEIKKSNILNIKINRMPAEEIPDGGHSNSLVIYKNEDVINSVPTYPESKYERILNNLFKAITDCIPDKIWKEVNSVDDDK